MPKIPALPYVRSGVTESLSANEAFRRYQAAAREASEQTGTHWTASARTTFLQQYSSIRSLRSEVTTALSAPKDVPAGGLRPVERETTRPGGFLMWGTAFIRPIGSGDVEQTFHPIRTRELLTPAELEARIRDFIEDKSVESHGSFYRYTIDSIAFTGVEKLIPERR